MTNDYSHRLPCPHPQCAGGINVRNSLPADEYLCPCKACKVRLTWATYLDRGRVPHVALVQMTPIVEEEESQ